MASQVQIPFEGVILQEHSAPISCLTPNFAKGSKDYEGPLRGWRNLKRDPPRVGKGEKISTKGANVSVKAVED